uniref:Uncharacterized protein n=1 Tax=Timema bartmani TaxID=61472 RepID=A0A7R9F3J1_9NEOP|nr:unnamed protein product [Timema bartmani]
MNNPIWPLPPLAMIELTFADKGCHVVSTTNPLAVNLSFLDRNCYLFIQDMNALSYQGIVMVSERKIGVELYHRLETTGITGMVRKTRQKKPNHFFTTSRLTTRGSVPAFVWRENGKPFRENHPHYTQPGFNYDLPAIGRLVYCEDGALHYAAIEVGKGQTLGGEELTSLTNYGALTMQVTSPSHLLHVFSLLAISSDATLIRLCTNKLLYALITTRVVHYTFSTVQRDKSCLFTLLILDKEISGCLLLPEFSTSISTFQGQMWNVSPSLLMSSDRMKPSSVGRPKSNRHTGDNYQCPGDPLHTHSPLKLSVDA